MSQFSRLIRFESASNGEIFFADLGTDTVEPPSLGSKITAYASIEDLSAQKNESTIMLGR